MGRVVDGVDENNLCVEKKMLAITLFSKTRELQEVYFELRDILAVVTDDLKHKALTFRKTEPIHSYEHPVNLFEIVLDDNVIGRIGIAHPEVSKKIDKKAGIVFAEVDMKAFAEAEDKGIKYDEPSKFPPIDYDISLEIPNGVFYDSLAAVWANKGYEILKGTKIVDTYDTETVHSMTIRFCFSSAERTLSSAEVQTIMDEIIAGLAQIGVNLR